MLEQLYEHLVDRPYARIVQWLQARYDMLDDQPPDLYPIALILTQTMSAYRSLQETFGRVPDSVDDERYIASVGPGILDMVEAHFYHRDAYHLALIADGLRMVEARLAAGRADAVEAPGTVIQRIAYVWAIAEVHPDKARFLVPIAGSKRVPAPVEHVEYGTVGVGIHFREIDIYRMFQLRSGISQQCDDFIPQCGDSRKVLVLSQRTVEARRVEIEFVGACVM